MRRGCRLQLCHERERREREPQAEGGRMHRHRGGLQEAVEATLKEVEAARPAPAPQGKGSCGSLKLGSASLHPSSELA